MARLPLDDEHNSYALLARMLPEQYIAGGSFASMLPDPTNLHELDRRRLIAQARNTATDEVVRRLWEKLGVQARTQPDAARGGTHRWPKGYVGSLSHKGVAVIGVMIPRKICDAIGVDLEWVDPDYSHQGLSKSPPPASGTEQPQNYLATMQFSAREAAFKALAPTSGGKPTLDQVLLDEPQLPNGDLVTTASLDGKTAVHAHVKHAEYWIVGLSLPQDLAPKYCCQSDPRTSRG